MKDDTFTVPVEFREDETREGPGRIVGTSSRNRARRRRQVGGLYAWLADLPVDGDHVVPRASWRSGYEF